MGLSQKSPNTSQISAVIKCIFTASALQIRGESKVYNQGLFQELQPKQIGLFYNGTSMEFMHPDWGLFLIKYGHLTIIPGRNPDQIKDLCPTVFSWASDKTNLKRNVKILLCQHFFYSPGMREYKLVKGLRLYMMISERDIWPCESSCHRRRKAILQRCPSSLSNLWKVPHSAHAGWRCILGVQCPYCSNTPPLCAVNMAEMCVGI